MHKYRIVFTSSFIVDAIPKDIEKYIVDRYGFLPYHYEIKRLEKVSVGDGKFTIVETDHVL